MLDNTPAYRAVWDRVFRELGFAPSYADNTHSFDAALPFQLKVPYAVYAIDGMTEAQIRLLGETMRAVFRGITRAGQKMYALDWQHSAFLYDPHDPAGQERCQVADARYADGGYIAEFPMFYPDGDYYFFLDADFAFGYLGHPWRQEVWIFGADLLRETDAVYPVLGWRKLREDLPDGTAGDHAAALQMIQQIQQKYGECCQLCAPLPSAEYAAAEKILPPEILDILKISNGIKEMMTLPDVCGGKPFPVGWLLYSFEEMQTAAAYCAELFGASGTAFAGNGAGGYYILQSDGSIWLYEYAGEDGIFYAENLADYFKK